MSHQYLIYMSAENCSAKMFRAHFQPFEFCKGVFEHLQFHLIRLNQKPIWNNGRACIITTHHCCSKIDEILRLIFF